WCASAPPSRTSGPLARPTWGKTKSPARATKSLAKFMVSSALGARGPCPSRTVGGERRASPPEDLKKIEKGASEASYSGTMTDSSAPNMAVFCDYENVAIGSRESRFDEFDIELVLERLLDKGKIVVKKAYCDWDRYKSAKRPMHEAAFELIEIPHVSYSGKNSADIRMVVDALDLCYTKEHVDTFVIISGDSDFSPLVSKLRENDKTVIGVGVKKSSSDLLVDNCDEFIYYDDLVREFREARRAVQRAA